MNDIQVELNRLEDKAFRLCKGEAQSYHEVLNYIRPVQQATEALNRAYIALDKANKALDEDPLHGAYGPFEVRQA